MSMVSAPQSVAFCYGSLSKLIHRERSWKNTPSGLQAQRWVRCNRRGHSGKAFSVRFSSVHTDPRLWPGKSQGHHPPQAHIQSQTPPPGQVSPQRYSDRQTAQATPHSPFCESAADIQQVFPVLKITVFKLANKYWFSQQYRYLPTHPHPKR